MQPWKAMGPAKKLGWVVACVRSSETFGDGKKKTEREKRKACYFLHFSFFGLPFLCPVLVMVSSVDLSPFLAMSFGSDVWGL
jgi:hypothetical protein